MCVCVCACVCVCVRARMSAHIHVCLQSVYSRESALGLCEPNQTAQASGNTADLNGAQHTADSGLHPKRPRHAASKPAEISAAYQSQMQDKNPVNISSG